MSSLQVRSQREKEVYAKEGRGSGGRLEAPSGSIARAKLSWGARKLLGFSYTNIYFSALLVLL
jgi:hypothetical protein